MKSDDQHGFTLVEIIVTLVTASVLGVVMYSYARSAFSQSSLPVARLKDSFELHAAMENIISDYENHLNNAAQWEAGHAYAVGDIVYPATQNGHHYVCITAGTSHASTEPSLSTSTTWSATDQRVSDIADASVIWREALSFLKTQVEANAYGTYSVVSDETGFIKFKADGSNFKEDEAGMADGDPADILKVTITNEEGGRLTSLFTITD